MNSASAKLKEQAIGGKIFKLKISLRLLQHACGRFIHHEAIDLLKAEIKRLQELKG